MEGNIDGSMEETHADAIIGSSNNPNLGITETETETETTVSASETLRRYSLGYRFTPLDQELITGYLQRKIDGLALPTNLMHEVDIYLHTPEYLTVNYEAQGDKIWYFFTPRDKKYKNGSRPNRRAEDGYWKATGADKTIKTDDGREIGFRKALVYYRGNAPNGVKTSWIMHEFRVNGPSRHASLKRKRDMLLDYVLCRIYQNDESGKKKSRRKQKTEAVVVDEEGNNSSAEEEANNSNDTANANDNGNINQPSNDNTTGYDNKHNINQPSNKDMTVYNFSQLMSNNIMSSYNGFAQGYYINYTNQDVSSMQNYVLDSSSLMELEQRMMAVLSSYQPGDNTHNFTAATDHHQQQQQQQPSPPPPFPSNNYNYPAAPTQDITHILEMYPRSAPVSYKMIPTPR